MNCIFTLYTQNFFFFCYYPLKNFKKNCLTAFALNSIF